MKTIKVELCLTILKVLMKKNKKGKKDHLEGSSGFYQPVLVCGSEDHKTK